MEEKVSLIQASRDLISEVALYVKPSAHANEREVPSSCRDAPPLLTWLSPGSLASRSHPQWIRLPLGAGAIHENCHPP